MELANNAKQYWLLQGNTPAGPFPVHDLHSKLASSEITWDAMVCEVGQTQWLPMKSTPTLVPQTTAVSDVSNNSSTTMEVGQATGLTQGTNKQGAMSETAHWWYEQRYVAIFAAVVIGGCLLWAYFTPKQVSHVEACYRYFAAKNIIELRDATTPNMHPILNEMFKGPVNNLGNNLRFIDQSPAPAIYQGHFVSFYFDDVDEQQQVVTIEGVFHVVDKGGWKVDDIYIVSLNNRQMDKPISMAHQYWPLISKETPSYSRMKAAEFKGSDVMKWYQDPSERERLRKTSSSLATITSRGWGVLIVLGVMAAVGFMKKSK
jgi:hypothetical protein